MKKYWTRSIVLTLVLSMCFGMGSVYADEVPMEEEYYDDSIIIPVESEVELESESVEELISAEWDAPIENSIPFEETASLEPAVSTEEQSIQIDQIISAEEDYVEPVVSEPVEEEFALNTDQSQELVLEESEEEVEYQPESESGSELGSELGSDSEITLGTDAYVDSEPDSVQAPEPVLFYQTLETIAVQENVSDPYNPSVLWAWAANSWENLFQRSIEAENSTTDTLVRISGTFPEGAYAEARIVSLKEVETEELAALNAIRQETGLYAIMISVNTISGETISANDISVEIHNSRFFDVNNSDKQVCVYQYDAFHDQLVLSSDAVAWDDVMACSISGFPQWLLLTVYDANYVPIVEMQAEDQQASETIVEQLFEDDQLSAEKIAVETIGQTDEESNREIAEENIDETAGELAAETTEEINAEELQFTTSIIENSPSIEESEQPGIIDDNNQNAEIEEVVEATIEEVSEEDLEEILEDTSQETSENDHDHVYVNGICETCGELEAGYILQTDYEEELDYIIPMAASAGSVSTYNISVTYGQTEARSMLSMVNEFRTGNDAWYWAEDNINKVTCSGLSELTYDYNLEKVAMLRAAEIALSFDHTRPNGTICWQAYKDLGYSYTACAENIALGESTASDAYVDWREDSEDYSGQGHRRNMLNSTFNRIGIGHVYYNGIHYWVQEFATSTNGVGNTVANDSSTSMDISILESNITSINTETTPTSVELAENATGSVPVVKVYLGIKEHYGGRCYVNVDYNWTVGDTSVVVLSGGKLQPKKAGTTNLSTVVYGKTVTVPVTVSHVIVNDAAVEATCTAAGKTAGTHCSVCNKIITPQEEISAKGHQITLVDAVSPTLNQKGHIAYYYCKDCGRYFSDKQGKNQITKADTEIAKLINIGSATVTGIVKKTYSGNNTTQNPVITLGNKTLVKGTDYTLSYKNQKNAGTATLIITGIGLYGGSVSASFTISAKNITPTITLSPASCTYDGKPKTPTVTVKDGSTTLAASNYSVAYSNNTNAGTAKVVVTMKGNYSGSATKSFIITGWQQVSGKWYYVNSSGAKVTGWQQISGKWYYFDGTAVMQTGWQKIGGKWYYFASSGAMVTGWQKISSKWYYFTGSGAMVTGWQQISNKWYYFTGSGAMVTGWQQISSKWYYFTSGGAMVTSWQKIGSKWYYFTSGGAMVTSWQKIGGKWYYFTNSGPMVTGWQKIDDTWYYFTSEGNMVTGTQVIDGKTYKFNSSGSLAS